VSAVSVPVSLGARSYEIRIESGLLSAIGDALHTAGLSGKAAVVSNPTVARLYGNTVQSSLRKAGFQACVILVPDGERAKHLRWVSYILDELTKRSFERSSVLIALGGGVVGDVAGFAAAVYVRGIPFVQVPTTLVAQVDSSVGGKTGVNHALGKNLIGAFHQPRVVLMDPDTLMSLPAREWVAGLAEVIKYGMIADEAFFEYLERKMGALLKRDREAVVHIVARSCAIKADVVAEDERETDRRRILNYGHTIGHALEAIGRYRRFLHGEAVAIGMVHEADLARHMGWCGEDVVVRQRALVRQAGLPDRLPACRFAELWSAMLHDKKVSKGRVLCVLPERIGRVRIEPLERSSVIRWLSANRRWHGKKP
jgi:3-dehydroquinate synthase